MAQPGLFAQQPAPLVDDARGRIDYDPGFIDASLAAKWFAVLEAQVRWKSERRQMYEREVDVPRLMASFRLDELEHARTAERRAVAEVLLQAAARVRERVGAPFNAVGLNLYRDGRDSVAPHNDHLDEIAKGEPIALLSLGAARRMTIRAKRPPRQVLHVDLEPGSLLLMSYDTQLNFDHGIPKVEAPVAARISLAFRVKVERGARY